jgi:hypothetical protein
MLDLFTDIVCFNLLLTKCIPIFVLFGAESFMQFICSSSHPFGTLQIKIVN